MFFTLVNLNFPSSTKKTKLVLQVTYSTIFNIFNILILYVKREATCIIMCQDLGGFFLFIIALKPMDIY
jgi:hypothetical protein